MAGTAWGFAVRKSLNAKDATSIASSLARHPEGRWVYLHQGLVVNTRFPVDERLVDVVWIGFYTSASPSEILRDIEEVRPLNDPRDIALIKRFEELANR